MKTIQIPTTSNPFIVNINNHAYQYRSGETAEVPDEVAAAIEDSIELVPKPKRYLSRIAQLAEESLEELTEEDLAGISTITNCAFYSCKSIRKATIPDGVTIIGNNAFDWCTNLKSIYLPQIPPDVTNANAFGTVEMQDRTFYCKNQSSLDAYMAVPNWVQVAALAKFAVEA